jgi:1-acyl-sn-glycerol-3-phosphate acyltransferase
VKAPEPITPAYRAVMALSTPIVRGWGRLEVSGLEHLPERGPVLMAANHDSYWDPVAAGVAAIGRRQIRALAKSTLWDIHAVGWVLDGMGQIPVIRGATDTAALERAIAELRAGACIGVFPEGTRSRGRKLRARSGFGRLAAAVPEARLVLCAIEGTTDILRFPRRPRLRVTFFRPAGGERGDGETPAELTARLLAELRERSPVAALGRRPKPA